MMITEDYCSYEVARLLEEKGFDWDSTLSYDPIIKRIIMMNWKVASGYLPCLTHQMAMKWLREKGIYITIIPRVSKNTKTEEGFIEYYCSCDKRINTPPYNLMLWAEKEFTSKVYEEAVESALKYSLENLI